MTAPAFTTSSAPLFPAQDAAAVPFVPAPAEAAAETARAAESAPAPRARGPLGRLLARRARPKAATAPVVPPAEAGPSTPDVWLAGLRLGC
ncbi:hypothetical protein [Streptomyces aureus]|uniref:hypothetical protein n=1 Tax=Streptomyces aureus TaxID=193461 RepID=UPI0033D758EF